MIIVYATEIRGDGGGDSIATRDANFSSVFRATSFSFDLNPAKIKRHNYVEQLDYYKYISEVQMSAKNYPVSNTGVR